MAKWKRFRLKDFPIGKNGKPFIFGRQKDFSGLPSTKRPFFFPNKVRDDHVFIPIEIIEGYKSNTDYDIVFPNEV